MRKPKNLFTGEELVEYRNSGQRDYSNWVFPQHINHLRQYYANCDFSNSNLANLDCRFSFFQGTDFRGADLRNADFSGSDFRGANLIGANLINANLRGVDLRGVVIDESTKIDRKWRLIARMNQYHHHFFGDDPPPELDESEKIFKGEDLSGAWLGSALLPFENHLYFAGFDFEGANLSGAYLCYSNLINANLRDADLTGANLTGANLTGADLRGAKLSGARLGTSLLSGADLTNAILDSDVNLIGCEISKVAEFSQLENTAFQRLWLLEKQRIPEPPAGEDFHQVKFGGGYGKHEPGLDFSGLDFRGTDLSYCKLSNSSFRGADMRGAILNTATLGDADMSEADLRGADLRRTFLIGTNLDDARLEDADMRGATLDGVGNLKDDPDWDPAYMWVRIDQDRDDLRSRGAIVDDRAQLSKEQVEERDPRIKPGPAEIPSAWYRYIQSGGRDFSDSMLSPLLGMYRVNFHKGDFSRSDISNSDYCYCSFTDADFQDANMRNSDFTGADFRGANLVGANLLYSHLWGVDLRFAVIGKETKMHYKWRRVHSLVNTDLSSTSEEERNWEGVDLSGAFLGGSPRPPKRGNQNYAEFNFRGANLSGAILRYVSFAGANLREANLTGADLTGTNLSRADLRGANLTGARMHHTLLGGANLSGANLSGANLSNVRLDEIEEWHEALPEEFELRAKIFRGEKDLTAMLPGADLSNIDISYPEMIPHGEDTLQVRIDVDFSGVDMTGVDFSFSRICACNFQNAILRDAKLLGCSATLADFSGADLRGADMRGSWLVAARFDGALLEGTNMLYAKLNDADGLMVDPNELSFQDRDDFADRGAIVHDSNSIAVKWPLPDFHTWEHQADYDIRFG